MTRRAAHGLTLLSNIVWMKTIDIGSSGTEGQDGPSNPYNFNAYRGVADFDQALRVTGSANYPLPKFQREQFRWRLRQRLAGQRDRDFAKRLPITITSGVDNSESGIGNDLGVYNPGVSIARPAGAPKTEWFNPAAFAENPKPSAANGYAQSFGNVPRNSLRGPAFEDTDISLFKDIATEHRIHGQFQAEAFNTWNHTNFANPHVECQFRDIRNHHRNQHQHRDRQFGHNCRGAACLSVCSQDHLLTHCRGHVCWRGPGLFLFASFSAAPLSAHTPDQEVRQKLRGFFRVVKSCVILCVQVREK